MIDIGPVLISFIKKVTEDIYAITKGPIQKKIAVLRASNNVDNLVTYYEHLNQVKTIISPEKISRLTDIYFPHILSNYNQHLTTDEFVAYIHDGFQTKRLLIEGTGGHGKSILMKYICISELKSAKSIPILIPLRNHKNNETLLSLITREFQIYGFDNDIRLLIYFARKGKLLILLDGFDELAPSVQDDICLDLKAILNRFRLIKLVVTSRPNTNIRSAEYLTNFQLNTLTQKAQHSFIDHQLPEHYKGQNTELHRAIVQSNFVSEVLVTPLLLSLLIIAYRSESRIPDNLIDFYRLLFPTMLYRHDDMKYGFTRYRKSNYGKYELQELFEIFCYISTRKQKIRMDGMTFRKMIQESACKQGREINESEIENILYDLVTITCLIVEDGLDDYMFIHRTIQEFYAAACISRASESSITSFISHLFKHETEYFSWGYVPNFLFGLCRIEYIRHFVIPNYNFYFNKNGGLSLDFKNKVIEHGRIICVEDGELKYVDFERNQIEAINKKLWEVMKRAVNDYFIQYSADLEYLVTHFDCEVEVEYAHFDEFRISITEFRIPITYYLEKTNQWGNLRSFINQRCAKNVRIEKKKLQKEIEISSLKEDLFDFK